MVHMGHPPPHPILNTSHHRKERRSLGVARPNRRTVPDLNHSPRAEEARCTQGFSGSTDLHSLNHVLCVPRLTLVPREALVSNREFEVC